MSVLILSLRGTMDLAQSVKG